MPRFYRGRRIVPPEADTSWMQQTLGTEPPPPAKPRGSMKRRGPLAHTRIGPGGVEETEAERAERVARREWIKSHNISDQCVWCGLVRQGPRKGPHTRLFPPFKPNGEEDTTSTYCPDCYEEQRRSNFRDIERARMTREGYSEEELRPRILSRLERQTGVDPATTHHLPEDVELPIIAELGPIE